LRGKKGAEIWYGAVLHGTQQIPGKACISGENANLTRASGCFDNSRQVHFYFPGMPDFTAFPGFDPRKKGQKRGKNNPES
jgi:hypothetical protein